eukprot:TRINITY_DN157_c0_g1_i1.p2 TRINITY_DN157_c0_g1~~TRINITY_DN157_c0_g1_i1.p2  ORF type:complete len:323 (+),score=136.76 TRINITY_DN157_c0_g1_i1:175-1143(+)
MTTALASLKEWTLVVADTGDFKLIEKYQPQDSTTNPSLIYAASRIPQYAHLVDEAVTFGKTKGKDRNESVSLAMDKLAVNFGLEILKLVPGRVSTEIDARLSFDTDATVKKAHEIIALYKDAGIDKERILIKIASTWEGLQAARILEKEGIHCNLTLLFNLAQAAVAAEVGVTLISPFVGRITDFYKKRDNVALSYSVDQDPGIISVRRIFNYYKYHGYKTIVMGASFRSAEQVLALSGCDALTISPALLEELASRQAGTSQQLDASKAEAVPKIDVSEKSFRWELNQDEMATSKLAEGIRGFAADLAKLEADITKKIDERN